MPGKQVSQTTFDAIVREAITDFGHTPEDAINEAKDQLRLMGITDFSNLLNPTIEKDTNHQDHPVIQLTKQLAQSTDLQTKSDIATHLIQYITDDQNIASVIGANDGIPAAIDLLQLAHQMEKDDSLSSNYYMYIVHACNLTAALCDKQELNRSRFIMKTSHQTVDGIGLLVDLLRKKIIIREEITSQHQWTTISAILSATIAIQNKNEAVKQRIVANHTLDHLVYLLDYSANNLFDPHQNMNVQIIQKVFRQTCTIFRQTLSADDASVNVSETFNRARALNGSSSVMSSGLSSVKYDKNVIQILSQLVQTLLETNHTNINRYELLVDCIKTTKMCMIADEVCKNVLSLALHKLVVKVLNEYNQDYAVVIACIAMLRNLSGHDQAKTFLFENIHHVTSSLTGFLCKTSYIRLFDHYAGLLSGICMKRADIADKLASSNAYELLLEAMAAYSDDASFQKISCIAIRNACSRDGLARSKIRDGKQAEKLIRKARKTWPAQCEDVAYDALYRMDVLKDNELRKLKGYTMPTDLTKMPQ